MSHGRGVTFFLPSPPVTDRGARALCLRKRDLAQSGSSLLQNSTAFRTGHPFSIKMATLDCSSNTHRPAMRLHPESPECTWVGEARADRHHQSREITLCPDAQIRASPKLAFCIPSDTIRL
jgi:hypothetical protein